MEDTPDELPLAVRKPYLTFQLAESKAGRRLEDREAYDLLHDGGLPKDAGDLGELKAYALPEFGMVTADSEWDRLRIPSRA